MAKSCKRCTCHLQQYTDQKKRELAATVLPTAFWLPARDHEYLLMNTFGLLPVKLSLRSRNALMVERKFKYVRDSNSSTQQQLRTHPWVNN